MRSNSYGIIGLSTAAFAFKKCVKSVLSFRLEKNFFLFAEEQDSLNSGENCRSLNRMLLEQLLKHDSKISIKKEKKEKILHTLGREERSKYCKKNLTLSFIIYFRVFGAT